MDKKEIARRSDALYADGVRYHRRDLCDMIAYREADIKQLKEENKKLREELEAVGTAAYLYGRDDLKADNARLRKLTTGLYRCWLGEGCDGCPMQDSDGWCIRDLQLHELGIEAPE